MSNKHIAKIENDFILKAHYSLSEVEQKIVLFLASRLDPQNEKKFIKQVIPIKEIEAFFWKNNKIGDVYTYLQVVCERLLSRKITFPNGTVINGRKISGGGINWFQSILVEHTEKGASIEFMFSERMKPFLLELNRYVRINAMEIMDMRGRHAIRLYQIFKVERERTKKFKNVSTITYGVDELKAILDISGKYKALKDLRRRVLEPTKSEINTYSQEISITYSYIKTRRKVTGIEFSIFDKTKQVITIEEPRKQLESYHPDEEDLAKLTFAQDKAYKTLLEFGVYGGIAYKQILPTIKGADMEGYEDLFVEQAILLFKSKEKGQKNNKDKSAGAFVNWWTKKKVFDISRDVFFQISDKVFAIRKKLDQERLDNRAYAKDMTKAEFEEWYKKDRKKE